MQGRNLFAGAAPIEDDHFQVFTLPQQVRNAAGTGVAAFRQQAVAVSVAAEQEQA